MSLDKEQVIEFLSNMPVIELAGIITDLEEKWGVSAAAPVAAAAAGPAGVFSQQDQLFLQIIASVSLDLNGLKTVGA